MAPSRPQRPSKKDRNSTRTGKNGTTPSRPVFAVTDGGETAVPVNNLPPTKPDGVPRDPRYRAAKAAYRPVVGSGPGVTDPVVQCDMLSMTYDGDGDVLAARAETAAAIEHGVTNDAGRRELASGMEGATNATHVRGQRRLLPIMGQNFEGINNIQG